MIKEKTQFNKKRTIPLAIVFAVIIAASCIYALFFRTQSFSKTDMAMGTVISVKSYGTKNVESAALSAIDSVKSLDSAISKTSDTSDIGVLNSTGAVSPSAQTYDVIKKSLDVCRDSSGAFDITLGALSELWDIGGDSQRVPSQDEINEALKTCGYEKMSVDSSRITVPSGTHVDLGAAGKGAGAQAAVDTLKNTGGITGGIVSVGGTVGVFGKNPDSDHWGVGVRKPDRDATGYCAVISLYKDAFVSTSGSYEKYFEQDSKLYHHILSPSDGYPASSGLKSVTVVTYDDGTYADCLSTACFVLGYEKSIPLLEKYSADAFFIFDDGSTKSTDGLNVTLNE